MSEGLHDCSHKEIVRVPQCPVSSGPMFYAGAILAVNTLGILCWRRMPDGTVKHWWVVLISRVLDKSAAFTMDQLEFLLDECKRNGTLEGISKVQLISDTGTHFRSTKVAGSCAHGLLEKVRPAINSLGLFFGPESHFKFKVDGFFAELREAARQTALGKDILDDKDLVQCYKDWWTEAQVADPGKWDAHFHLYEPHCARHEVHVSQFKPSSLPKSIRGCHRWNFRLNDKRRTNLANSYGELTGVDVSCYGFVSGGILKVASTNRAIVLDQASTELKHTCQGPELPSGSEVPPPQQCLACAAGISIQNEEEPDDDEKRLAEVGVQTKSWRGWKISFRTQEPEKESAVSCFARLERKMAISTDKPFSTECSRTKTVMQRKEASDRTALKVREKSDLKKFLGLEPY